MLIMTLFSFNVSYGIIYYLHFFPQNQTAGLRPNGGTNQNCVYLMGGFGHHFDDTSCDYTNAPLCEAPRDGPA